EKPACDRHKAGNDTSVRSTGVVGGSCDQLGLPVFHSISDSSAAHWRVHRGDECGFECPRAICTLFCHFYASPSVFRRSTRPSAVSRPRTATFSGTHPSTQFSGAHTRVTALIPTPRYSPALHESNAPLNA
ncbi:hypothetical protein FRC09_016083, partial [Ceratobasidium sp. 395]